MSGPASERVGGRTQLAIVVHGLLQKLRENVTIDWTITEIVRAKLRVVVGRILTTYGYLSESSEQATGRCWSRRSCCGGVAARPLGHAREVLLEDFASFRQKGR